jgi:hypothetical protein
MRRIALALALASALAPTVVWAALGERWIDPATGFSIRPPQGWEVLPGPAPGVSVAFRGPREEAFSPSINVAVIPTPLEITPQTLRRTVDELQAQFGGDAPSPGAKDLTGKAPPVSRYHVTNARIVTLFGGKAGFLEASYAQAMGTGRASLRNFQVILSGSGSHTVITYTALADRYDQFVVDARASVNSFAAGAAPPGAAAAQKRWTDMGQLVGTVLAMVFLIGFMVFLMRRTRHRRH